MNRLKRTHLIWYQRVAGAPEAVVLVFGFFFFLFDSEGILIVRFKGEAVTCDFSRVNTDFKT